MPKLGKSFMKMIPIYQIFLDIALKTCPNLDCSEEAMMEQYEWETYGKRPVVSRKHGYDNGWTVAKQRVDIHITQWNEDIGLGLLHREELEGEFPNWWLDKVIVAKYAESLSYEEKVARFNLFYY